MRHPRAFALSDLLAALVVGALVLIYTYTMIGCDGGDPKDGKAAEIKVDPARVEAQRRQNTTHLVGIHKGMVLYAQGNKDFYPGLDSNGAKATLAIPAATGVSYGCDSTDGTQVVYRFAVLMRGNYFNREYLISPVETNAAIKAPGREMKLVDGASYSYAMLNISDPRAPRTSEWKATMNGRAPVLSDRNIGGGATGESAQSIHTKAGEGWKGSVVANDNHGDFENSDVIRTQFNLKGEIAADQLFSDAEKSDSGVANADAAMVFKSGNAYVNQQP